MGRGRVKASGRELPVLPYVISMTRKSAMARPELVLFLLLLSLQPSSLSQSDNTEGKAILASLILSALERATMFLEERLPEINLDGVVGFQVLEGE